MKLIRTIAMTTDYTYHGSPREVSRVELHLDPDMITPEVLAIAQQLQEERLLSMRKRILIRDANAPAPQWPKITA